MPRGGGERTSEALARGQFPFHEFIIAHYDRRWGMARRTLAPTCGNMVNIEGKGNPIQGVGRLTIVRGGHSILFQSRLATWLIIRIGQERPKTRLLSYHQGKFAC
jgi:hypothetical protein